jgi:glucose-6-phosphate 1-dehydrogenase
MTKHPGKVMIGMPVKLLASHHPSPGEMGAYERFLGDAMNGDPTQLAREAPLPPSGA